MSNSHKTLEGMGRVWRHVEVRVSVVDGESVASLWFGHEHNQNELMIGSAREAPTISEAVAELDAQFREELLDMLGLEEDDR